MLVAEAEQGSRPSDAGVMVALAAALRINDASLPGADRVAVQDGPMAESAIGEVLADMPGEPGVHLNPKRVKQWIAQDSDATP